MGSGARVFYDVEVPASQSCGVERRQCTVAYPSLHEYSQGHWPPCSCVLSVCFLSVHVERFVSVFSGFSS